MTLLTIELLLRIFMPQTTLSDIEKRAITIFKDGDFIPFTTKPNSRSEWVDLLHHEFHVNITIDSNGFRGINNNLNIISIGDSFTFGYGVQDNETYSYLLNITNAGYYCGISPDTYYLCIKNLKYKPKIILLNIFVGNDITDIGDNEWVELNGLPTKIKSRIYYVDEQGRLRNKQYISNNFYNTIGNLLWRHSQLYNLIKYNFNLNKNKECITCENYWTNNKENFDKFVRSMDGIKDYTDKNNIKLLVLLIPAKSQWNNLPQQKVKQSLNGVETVDLFDMSQNQSLYFKKDIHINNFGNKYIADVIKWKI